MKLGNKRGMAATAWLDMLAVGASTACLIHCLLLPLLFALLPALASLGGVPEAFHLWALALAIPASAVAMISGYRHHNLLHPAMLGALGIAFLAVGALAGLRLVSEMGFSVAGSVLLASAHLRNWGLRRDASAGGAGRQTDADRGSA